VDGESGGCGPPLIYRLEIQTMAGCSQAVLSVRPEPVEGPSWHSHALWFDRLTTNGDSQHFRLHPRVSVSIKPGEHDFHLQLVEPARRNHSLWQASLPCTRQPWVGLSNSRWRSWATWAWVAQFDKIQRTLPRCDGLYGSQSILFSPITVENCRLAFMRVPEVLISATRLLRSKTQGRKSTRRRTFR
jgi:hypothetical protein